MKSKDWLKRDNIDKFLDRYTKSKKFKFTEEKTPTCLKIESSVIEQLLTRDRKIINQIEVEDLSGQKLRLVHLFKSSEYGGIIPRTHKETLTLEKLKDQLSAHEAPISLLVANTIYQVCDVISTPGIPKSDFHFVNSDGEDCVWISHKDGLTADNFQQYGGMSGSRESEIFFHPETQDWFQTVKETFPAGVPEGSSYFRKISDDKIKFLSAYGKEYGKSYSKNNVTLLIQGEINIKKQDDYYCLEAHHIKTNGEKLEDTYEPVFTVKYTNDRKFEDIPNTRALITPIGTRKMIEL